MEWYWRSIWLVYAKLISASQWNCLFIIYYFVQIRTLFSRGAVLIFSWLQERSSAKNNVQTAVPSSCNERTSFRTMTVFSFGIRTSFRPFERFCSVRKPRTAFERPFFSIIFTGVGTHRSKPELNVQKRTGVQIRTLSLDQPTTTVGPATGHCWAYLDQDEPTLSRILAHHWTLRWYNF